MRSSKQLKNIFREEILESSVPIQVDNKIVLSLNWNKLRQEDKIFLDEFNPEKEDIGFFGTTYCFAMIVLDERFMSENIVHLLTLPLRFPNDIINDLLEDIPLKDLHITNADKIRLINRLQYFK